MAAGQKFTRFALDVGLKVHNLDTDTLKIMLTNVAPSAANAVKADLTELGAGHGYTAGGFDAQGAWTSIAGVATLVCTDVLLTAAGGSIGPWQYAALYNATASGGPLIAFWDSGSSQTTADGDSVTLDFAATTITLS